MSDLEDSLNSFRDDYGSGDSSQGSFDSVTISDGFEPKSRAVEILAPLVPFNIDLTNRSVGLDAYKLENVSYKTSSLCS